MPTFSILKAPTDRHRDHPQGRTPDRSRRSDHPLHRRRRHRARHLAGQRARVRRGGGEGVRRRQADSLVRGAGGREGQGAARRVAAERHARGGPHLQGRHQGAADDAGRRRHPQPQRHAAAGARSLRLRAAGPLLHRHARAGDASRADERRHLPREHRGRLRGHRVGARHTAGGKGDRVPRARDGQAHPSGLGHRHQADLGDRHQAPRPHGDSVRHRQQAQDGHHRAQGQHHEVHGGRVPRLGLRGGEGRVPRQDRHRGRGHGRRLARRQGPRSTTASPTACSSRC